jgi:hypothetical protein
MALGLLSNSSRVPSWEGGTGLPAVRATILVLPISATIAVAESLSIHLHTSTVLGFANQTIAPFSNSVLFSISRL